MARKASVKRKTKETDVTCSLTIEGTGTAKASSGNAFMDHMLTLFAKHGLFDCVIACKGDTDVDFHHSAEDIGICLGQALNKALADRAGITRFGTSHAPMDESLARVCIDISGRPNLVYNVKLSAQTVNDFECDLVHDFFKALTDNGLFTMHVDLLRGRNGHHSLEAVFKAFGLALSQACAKNPRAGKSIPSSKGTLS
jgi:imidazoleglycerol-phosphate dehydratase